MKPNLIVDEIKDLKPMKTCPKLPDCHSGSDKRQRNSYLRDDINIFHSCVDNQHFEDYRNVARAGRFGFFLMLFLFFSSPDKVEIKKKKNCPNSSEFTF